MALARRFAFTREVRTFLILAALSLLLVFADRTKVITVLRRSVESILVPVERAVFDASPAVRSPVDALRYWRSGTARIADLERQVTQLTVDSAKLSSLEEENQAMRRLLGAPLPRQWKFIPAPIIGRGDEISLGVGAVDGVEEGDAVIWEEVLLGTVAHVSQRQSLMLSVSDSRSSIPVYLPDSGADGLLQGRFSSQMLLTQVLQSANLPLGTVVVTSGTFGPPRGLVVGKVSEILSDETAIFQEAVVEPTLSLDSVSTVFVTKL
ncbi:MAG: hypothetical protein A2785_01670 [Candidatus Chisholmbacteria bacterium RIFCSPHIGHO2_01_FULL_49_18]|uniref:Cell shape-determining protein MreC n=2 Tax=Candidatus Chisholmiibacteriota TaxID=1817900 RepID=A0A1G1VLI3_9BACT|nr:MAG: hypothetical protein A2785_01670 [Candidatus Chisholmbacteria bacterium RIFCSPHIGHO2_01_FULL_49_18]OGY21746.1 MAG: hypothetical protein A3A65_02145 [Candidatus Chisholmbacteria bacterium RIFCSPLOWO2_01_FULL_49_14]